MGLVSVRVRGRRLEVLGRGADPCCTDTGPDEMHSGWQAWIDLRAVRPPDPPFWISLAPFGDLRGDDLASFLQATLLVRGALPQTLTSADVAALVTRWPASAAALRRWPPGIVRDGATTLLRVWSERSEREPGRSCRLLEKHEAGIGPDGRVVFREPVVFGVGSSLGAPCADPLPTQ